MEASALTIEKVYNKLVRDKITDIIQQAGNEPFTYIASEEEVKDLLCAKLLEEFEEFRKTPIEEEFADILEVIEGIAKVYNLDMNIVRQIKQNKKEERGSFEKRIVLEKVIEKE